MAYIKVDLEDYKNEIKETFCDRKHCLLNHTSRGFKGKFKEYIMDLEKSIYIFQDCKKTPEDFLRDLKYLYSELF